MRGQSIAPLRAHRRAAAAPLRVSRGLRVIVESGGGEGAGRRAAGAIAAVQCGDSGGLAAAWRSRRVSCGGAAKDVRKLPFSSLAAVSSFGHRSALHAQKRVPFRGHY